MDLRLCRGPRAGRLAGSAEDHSPFAGGVAVDGLEGAVGERDAHFINVRGVEGQERSGHGRVLFSVGEEDGGDAEPDGDQESNNHRCS